MPAHDEYRTDIGGFCSPVIFYDPSGEMGSGMVDAIAQQTDIMPTVLSAVGYPNPFVAFGVDLLSTPPDSTWAVHYYNNNYQYVRQGYLLVFDGEKALGLYNMAADPMQRNNLINNPDEQRRVIDYSRHTKAIIQSYMQRMVGDSLTVR